MMTTLTAALKSQIRPFYPDPQPRKVNEVYSGPGPILRQSFFFVEICSVVVFFCVILLTNQQTRRTRRLLRGGNKKQNFIFSFHICNL